MGTKLKSLIDALPAIANALGDSFGVQIRTGTAAQTVGDVVYLPPLDAENPKSNILGLGYTVHESAHVRYSNFGLTFSTPLEKHISGILEDVRIEKAMATDFPGTAKMLADLAGEMVESGFFSEPGETESQTKIMLDHVFYGLRRNVLHQEVLGEYAKLAEQVAAQTLPKGMFTRLNALMYQVEKCASEADVLDLAKAIITMIEDEAKKEEEKAEENRAQEQSQGGDQQSQPQSQPGSSTQDQATQGENPEQQGQGQKSGDTDPDDEQPSGSSGDGAASDAEANAELLKAILGAGDEDWKDMGKAVAEMLDQQACPIGRASATPFKSVPVEGVIPRDTSEAKARTASATNGLRHKMQNVLQARTFAVKRSSSFGTKLNFKKLHQAPLMGAVFEKVKEGKAIDTAIAILVDLSGSMEGREQLALDAALATMQAFQRPNVATAAFAFPNPQQRNSNAVLKMWQELPTAAILRSMKMFANGSTPMAEAMYGAGIEICKRREKRKILFVVTDGAPNNIEQASWVIDTARQTGIEVLGLGISYDVGRLFGDQFSTRISDIDELPQSMIGLLEKFV